MAFWGMGELLGIEWIGWSGLDWYEWIWMDGWLGWIDGWIDGWGMECEGVFPVLSVCSSVYLFSCLS